MRESFDKIADPYPEETDVKFCELLLKYFKGVVLEPLLSRLKENIPMGAWSIFCTPESFMNLPASPIFPSNENETAVDEPNVGRRETLRAAGGSPLFREDLSQQATAVEPLCVEKVEGAAKTYPREKIIYKVTKYNRKD